MEPIPCDLDLEPIKNFLQTALQAKIQGNHVQYNVILHQLKVRDDPDILWKVILCLNSFTPLLTTR